MDGKQLRTIILLSGILIITLVLQYMMVREGFESASVPAASETTPKTETPSTTTTATPTTTTVSPPEKIQNPEVKPVSGEMNAVSIQDAQLTDLVDGRIQQAMSKIQFPRPEVRIDGVEYAMKETFTPY
jgi:regulatory protein YycH of two-component signal transduction system YycFG